MSTYSGNCFLQRITPSDPGVELKELGEKLCRLIGHSSIISASSLPSLNSLSSNGMPSAKVSDGSLVSLPSLNGMQSRGKSEEEKQREYELYKQLKKRKSELEEKLLAKLDELREVCIKEAEITGELPKEIYKTLLPGEEEPKIQRRIGTSFCLSEEIFKRPIDSKDRISMLETDVELHRKIVAAAERLAKDKNTNKSVRKKRQKDLIAATQKLRGLEFGLNQLRLSASKPDVSTSTHNTHRNINAWGKDSSCQAESTSMRCGNDSNAFITKSCPTTPRGSFPDLRSPISNDRNEVDGEEDVEKTSSECSQRFPTTSACSTILSAHYSTDTNSTISAESGSRNNDWMSSKISRQTAQVPSLPPHFPDRYFPSHREISWERLAWHNIDNHHLPIYENVGYKSCASYKSSYRETNFPTLIDHKNLKNRVHRAFSDHDLPEPETTASAGTEKVGSRAYCAEVTGPSRNIVEYEITRKQQKEKFSAGQQNSQDVCATAEGADVFRGAVTHQIINEPSTSSLSSCQQTSSKLKNLSFDKYPRSSPPTGSLLLNDGKTPFRYALLPTSRSFNDGFTTASLDRRAVKGRQTSCTSMEYHQVRSPQMGDVESAADSAPEMPQDQFVVRHSPLNASRCTTTFPASSCSANIEKSKPLMSADIRRYQQHSPLQQHIQRTLNGSSTSNLRPPPPAYPNVVRSGVFRGNSSQEQIAERRTDSRTDFYKDKRRGREKNATAV